MMRCKCDRVDFLPHRAWAHSLPFRFKSTSLFPSPKGKKLHFLLTKKNKKKKIIIIITRSHELARHFIFTLSPLPPRRTRSSLFRASLAMAIPVEEAIAALSTFSLEVLRDLIVFFFFSALCSPQCRSPRPIWLSFAGSPRLWLIRCSSSAYVLYMG